MLSLSDPVSQISTQQLRWLQILFRNQLLSPLSLRAAAGISDRMLEMYGLDFHVGFSGATVFVVHVRSCLTHSYLCHGSLVHILTGSTFSWFISLLPSAVIGRIAN